MKRTRTTGNSRAWYADGVGEHYRDVAATYRNPHAPIVAACITRAATEWSLDLSHVLDLAAGAGEATLAVRAIAPGVKIEAIDPFTGPAYTSATGLRCEAITFEQIAFGALASRRYSLVICSFAMHLAPLSVLPSLAVALAQVAPTLVILTPHQRPALEASMGWNFDREFRLERVRTRLYRSTLVE